MSYIDLTDSELEPVLNMSYTLESSETEQSKLMDKLHTIMTTVDIFVKNSHQVTIMTNSGSFCYNMTIVPYDTFYTIEYYMSMMMSLIEGLISSDDNKTQIDLIIFDNSAMTSQNNVMMNNIKKLSSDKQKMIYDKLGMCGKKGMTITQLNYILKYKGIDISELTTDILSDIEQIVMNKTLFDL